MSKLHAVALRTYRSDNVRQEMCVSEAQRQENRRLAIHFLYRERGRDEAEAHAFRDFMQLRCGRIAVISLHQRCVSVKPRDKKPVDFQYILCTEREEAAHLSSNFMQMRSIVITL